MKNLSIISLATAVILLLFGCGRHELQLGDTPENVANIIKTLQECPSWFTAFGKNNNTELLDITNKYKTLMRYDNAAIRSALVKIESDPSYAVPPAIGVKEHALFRVLFDIPPGYRPIEESRAYVVASAFWGANTPAQDFKQGYEIDILWPYTIDKNGNLVFSEVKNNPIPYSGSLYSPTKEFDFMVKYYKRRTK